MRRGFTCGGRTHAASVLVAAVRHATCLLCDVEYDSWGQHAACASHIARSAICRSFVVPERHDAMMQQLWKHIRMDFEYIDDVTHKKEDRRRGRLASTIRHLRERGVLYHSVPKLSVDNGATTVNISKDAFVNFMLLGESYAKQETIDRVARLMPRLEAGELSSVVRYILSKRRLSRLFDELDMKQIVTHDSVPAGNGAEGKSEEVNEESSDPSINCSETRKEMLHLRQEEKSVIILSCLGELQMYSRQDRSHGVATQTAAEQLVLNVLGTHVMENIIAELVHEVLQRVVEEGTPVWRAYCSELADKMFEGTRAKPSPLNSSPTPPMATSNVSENRANELASLYTLEERSATLSSLPTVGRRLWHDVMRSLALDPTVPNPVNKSAVLAAMAPRLSSKKKTST